MHRNELCVGFEVLTGEVTNSIFWDITTCTPLKVNRHFGETYRLHLQGRISRARYLCVKAMALGLLPANRSNDRPKRRVTFKGLHGDSAKVKPDNT
jgi:hypothetical protein